jgi:hypothetical protein
VSTSIAFTPSASVTFTPDSISGTFAIPAPDGTHNDIVVTNGSLSTLAFQLGTASSMPAFASGCITLAGGASVLLTTPAIAANSASNPAVYGAGQATNAATATLMAAQLLVARGGAVTVTRGTASAQVTF